MDNDQLAEPVGSRLIAPNHLADEGFARRRCLGLSGSTVGPRRKFIVNESAGLDRMPD